MILAVLFSAFCLVGNSICGFLLLTSPDVPLWVKAWAAGAGLRLILDDVAKIASVKDVAGARSGLGEATQPAPAERISSAPRASTPGASGDSPRSRH